jgi:hypothetical protein
MSNSYWGGSSVHGGRVRRLQASTFRELVERYVFLPVNFPMTRKEFFALPEDERNSRKDGPFITACEFNFENEGHRCDDNATSIHMVILDLDSHGGEFNSSPETIGEHLFPFSYVAWQTAKHTAKKPRLKIAVDVSPCHPSLHRRFVRFISRRLGLPDSFSGSRESGVISQPQYRPIHFREEEFSAVIASRLDGKSVHEDDLPPEEDEDEIERTFAADREDGDETGLGLAYLPVSNLTLEQVEEALDAIDPDCGYKQWYEIAAALRHQFTDEDEARQAYELFDEWSSRGDKYRGEKDTYAKWKSFRPYARGRAPVTIRTLFKHAQESGWDNSKVAAAIQKTVDEWLAACESADELMQEGAKRIAAMPFRNDVVEEALILAWRTRIAMLTKNNIDKSILRREVARARKQDSAAKFDQHKENLPPWLQPQCYVATEDVFFNFATGVKLKPAAFDRYFEKELMPKEGDIPANGKPIMTPSSYSLNLMDIPRVDGTIYCPLHQGEDPFFEINGRRFLNTFDRIHLPVEDPDYAEKAGEMLTSHIAALIDEEWIQRTVLDFLAYLVQHPGRKIRWLPCIQSAEGTGKGFLSKILMGVLGAGNVKVISPEIIRSEWNDWMIGAQLFVLEEIYFPGERKEAVMNGLKQFITDETLPINQRNTTARQEPNWGNSLAFTNTPDALHLKGWDRRWMFIRSPLQTAEQVARLNESGHFERMEWLLTDAGAGGLRYWLKKRRISDEFPVDGPAPHTVYRTSLIEESKNSMQLTIEDLIVDDEHPLISEKVIHMGRLTELMSRGMTGKDTNRYAHYLTVMGFERWQGGTRIMLDGTRGVIWVHRQKFDKDSDPVEYLRKRMTIMGDEFEI